MSTTSQTTSLASTLVARFLRSNNYTQTLDIFIREAGLSADAGQPGNDEDDRDGNNNWTIEGVLEEKKAFDKSIAFERHNEDESRKDVWSVPAPSKPTIIQTPTASNLLTASVEPWQQPGGNHNHETSQPSSSPSSYLVATGADRQLHLFQTARGNELVKSFTGHSDSPILSYATIRNGRYVFMTNMSGQLILQRGAEVLGRRKDHSKYAVKVVACEKEADSGSGKVLVATAGWDARICVYEFDIPVDDGGDGGDAVVNISEPAGYINVTTNPETMLFVRHDLGRIMLLVSRRDSTHLYYYQVDSLSAATSPTECKLLGKQNLAPHSNAWVTFSPSAVALSPHDPGLLAVATSSLPHMKVIIVRLLFPRAETFGHDNAHAEPEPETQATQALAALALQDREDAAILIQANTFAPQTAYSTPQIVWRPDGSGVWVNGDDGVVRGIEARTGKVVSMLKQGHEVGYKVRTIWAGWVEVPKNDDGVEAGVEEWVVSGGFDKRLIVWKV